MAGLVLRIYSWSGAIRNAVNAIVSMFFFFMASSELTGIVYNDHLSLGLVPQISAWIPNPIIGLHISASIRRPNGNLIPAGTH